MKFRCEREALAEAMVVAGRATSGRSASSPVLQGLLFNLAGDRLTITGSDSELTIKVSIEVGGDADGSTVLPARLSSDIVRSLPSGRVEFSVEGEEVHISNGRSKFTLRPFNHDDYPKVVIPTTASVTLPSAEFGEALRQVVRAASKDESRQQLVGVLMTSENNGLRMVATDSYRLAMRDLVGKEAPPADKRVVVPRRALEELQRLVNSGEQVLMKLDDRAAAFEVGNVSLTTRLVEAEFPNYRNLVQHNATGVLTVEREALLDAIRRVRIFAREANALRLKIDADSVRLHATDRDQGEASEEVDAQFTGDPLEIAFNHDYLAEGVEACSGDQITISTISNGKPAILRGSGSEDYMYLLMPVRLP